MQRLSEPLWAYSSLGPSSVRESELQRPWVPSCAALFLDGLANETVGKSRCDLYLHVAPGRRGNRMQAGKVHRLILAAATGDLTTRRVLTFNHHFHNLPYLHRIIGSLNLSLPVQQYLKPVCFFAFLD